MTDDELDRRLRQALSVSPGVELTTRIRARIADEPEQRPAWRWRAAIAGGLACAGFAAMVFTSRTAPPDVPVEVATAPAMIAAASDDVATTAVGPSSPANSPASRAVRRRPVTTVPLAPTVPEPRLAPGDGEAFRVLLAFSRAAIATTEPDAPLAAVDPLVLPAIDIVPIVVAPLTLADELIRGGSQ
jgi:hypothetical protein